MSKKDILTLEEGTDNPETSVQNQPRPRNIPEEDRIQKNRSGSLWPLISIFTSFCDMFRSYRVISRLKILVKPHKSHI